MGWGGLGRTAEEKGIWNKTGQALVHARTEFGHMLIGSIHWVFRRFVVGYPVTVSEFG